MIGRVSAVALAGLLAACRFDPAGLPGGGNPDARVADASTKTPDASPIEADASPCGGDFVIQLHVDGRDEAPAPGGPFASVLLGDRVRLSAAGSCVARGPISYQWVISPGGDGTAATAEPGLDAEELDIYSLVPDVAYTARLEVTDGAGASQAREVLAFVASGWTSFGPAPGDGDVRDLHFGGGDVWFAAHDGPYRLSIADRAGGFHDVDAELDGDDPGSDMQTVWFDDAAALAWFGHKGARNGIWRVSRAAGRIDLIRTDGASALGASTVMHDIGGAGPGVAVASDLGVTTAPDNLVFSTRFTPLAPAVFALGRGTTAAWAGGARLYDLAVEGAVIDPFGGGVGPDDKIRAIAVDDERGETWIATQGNGVVRMRTLSGETLAVYGEDDGLADTDVRDLVIETSGDFAGDVWAATKSGVSRWLRERDEWVAMSKPQGLVTDDVRAVTIDSERWIYGGTDKGVVYIRLP